MYFLPGFYTVLQLFAVIGIGFVIRQFGSLNDIFFSSLSKFTVRVALPLYLFTKISGSDTDALTKSPLFLLAAVIILGSGVFISHLLFSHSSLNINQKRAGTALSGFGNYGTIPFNVVEILPVTLPVIAEAFGKEAPTLYIATYVFIAAPINWSIGNYLITGDGRKPKIRDFITPPFVAICLGYIVLSTGIQGLLESKELPFFHAFSALERIGSMNPPLSLLCLGAIISNLFRSKTNRSGLLLIAGLTSLVRFLILPSLFYASYFLFLRHLNLSPGQIWVLFLETHTPPSLGLAIMAQNRGVNEDYAANTLLITYGLYLLIFPFFLMLFLKLPGILQ